MIIREGRPDDVVRLLEIYNYEVVNGVATLDLREKTLCEWQEWFCEHNVDNHPLIVAEEDGRCVGYATLSAYRQKEAYSSTVELSIYIAPEFRRRGAASALMAEILRMAREDERTHNVVSVITSGNEASIKLHERFGFHFCGTIPQVGTKFGRMLDIDNFCLIV